jgi:TonB family protein
MLIGGLVWLAQREPVRVSVAHQGSIGVFVNVSAAPVGTTGAQPKPKPRPEPTVKAADSPADSEPVSNEAGAAGSATAGMAQGGGAVRMTSGDISLVRKVEPVYPQLMRIANREGTVTLDAIINPDGTIGEINVLSAGDPQFARAAVDAVSQWQYSPPGFRAVLTVTVIFNIR